MYKSKEEIVMTVMRCLPYANKISELDLASDPNAIRFTWKGSNKFRLSLTGGVEEVDGTLLRSTDMCLILKALLEKEYQSV